MRSMSSPCSGDGGPGEPCMLPIARGYHGARARPDRAGGVVGEAGPRILGRYEIQEEIGRGMMGIVYRALDPALGRTVALKTVSFLLAVPDEDRAGFEQRFLNEARVAAGLNHPGIVVVHDVGRDPGSDSLYIALEYL